MDLDFIKKIPKNPGVYLFKNSNEDVLYIGKATSLKDRVRQYFNGSEQKSRGVRILDLVNRTSKVDFIETDTALEALILEANLIKKYKPKFNIDGKDDKSYSYFVITKEEFPKVLILRKTDFKKDKYIKKEIVNGKRFGPYTSTQNMRLALKIIRKIFPFHNINEKSEKTCLDYQIGLCPGPYAGKVSVDDYKKNIRNISLFLSGRKKKILKELEVEMRKKAREEKFEEAEIIKRKIFSLKHINDISIMRKNADLDLITGDRVECYDISHIDGEYKVASMIVAVDGKLDKSKYRKFRIKNIRDIDDIASMKEVLSRRVRHFDDWGIPNVVVLDGGIGHINMAEKLFLSLNIPRTIGLLAVAKGPTRKKLDLYASKEFPVESYILKKVNFIEKLREEAHRFAINYHKKLREKDFLRIK